MLAGAALLLALSAAPASAAPAVATARPPARPARVEILAALGAAGGGSRWRGDGLGYGSLFVGLRLFRIVTPFFLTRVGYAGVDQRLLTFISAGLQAGHVIRERAWPYARLAFVHQHEESLASVAENPAGALLGIGVGIRHRAGLAAGLGCDFVVWQGRRGQIVLGPEVVLTYLGYSSGPDLYGFAGLNLGGSLQLF